MSSKNFIASFLLVTVIITWTLIRRCDAYRIDRDYCFNAQIREAYLIFADGLMIVKSAFVRTINDTTAVTQRFHIDYFHPQNKYWTSYQEDRRTLLFTFATPGKFRSINFPDRILADAMRISLRKADSESWLGEICVYIKAFRDESYRPATVRKAMCEKGFYGLGSYCVDINECADNTGNFCPAQQDCIDKVGSFSCPGKCLEDKLANKVTGVCEELCYHKGYQCHPKARCLYGKCVCNSGYQGDGFHCLDSCTAKGFSCDTNAVCAEGKCKCRDGYQGNGESCQAICHFNLKLCHPKAVCHLNECKCKAGYVGDGLLACLFSRKLYDIEMKKKNVVRGRLDIVETDVLEALHEFQRLRSALN